MSKGKGRVLVGDLQDEGGVRQEYQRDSHVRSPTSGSGKGDYQVRIHIIEARELKGRYVFSTTRHPLRPSCNNASS